MTTELEDDKLVQVPEVAKPEEIKPQVSSSGTVHTTMFHDSITDKSYPIISSHTPMKAIDKILSVMKYKGYVGILLAGESGTGKTTLVKWMIHQLHQRRNSFIIKWFHEEEFKRFTEIVNDLTKGVDHILIFDDISFQLEDMPKEDLNLLQKTLTTIRHKVKANVIVFMNIHYSKAIKKFFRATTQFRYLTSLSNEEINSYQDLFGPYSKWKLHDYSRIWSNMLTKGHAQFEISRWDNHFLTVQMFKPFNVVLASELNDLRFMVYTKESCAICDPDYEHKNILDVPKMVEDLVKSYGRDRTRGGIRWFNFARKGIDSLDNMNKALWRALADLDRFNDIDWHETQDYVDEKLTKKRHKVYNKKGFIEKTVSDAVQASSKPVQDEPEEIIKDAGVIDTNTGQRKEEIDKDKDIQEQNLINESNQNNMDYGFKDYTQEI